jgi:hypothetical protein
MELNTQSVVVFIEIKDPTGRAIRFKFPVVRKSYSKFSATNRNDEDLWEDVSATGTRIYVTRPKI